MQMSPMKPQNKQSIYPIHDLKISTQQAALEQNGQDCAPESRPLASREKRPADLASSAKAKKLEATQAPDEARSTHSLLAVQDQADERALQTLE